MLPGKIKSQDENRILVTKIFYKVLYINYLYSTEPYYTKY